MQKAKTRLFGVGGLALLAALTTAAINIPAKAESAGAEVEIEVVVYSSNPNIKFQSPLDGYETARITVPVVDVYSKAATINYVVTHDGQTIKNINYTPDTEDGVHKLDLNLSGFEYGTYVIKGTVTGVNGALAEDLTSFKYVPLMIVDTKTEDGKNPSITVEYGPDVDEICIDTVDKDGESVLTFCKDAEDDGDMEIELPFDENGIPSGEYDIIATPFIDGESADDDQATITYVAPVGPDVPSTDGGDEEVVPEVPNTGSLLQRIGLSRLDGTITSLIAFFMVALFAIILMNKKKSNKRK